MAEFYGRRACAYLDYLWAMPGDPYQLVTMVKEEVILCMALCLQVCCTSRAQVVPFTTYETNSTTMVSLSDDDKMTQPSPISADIDPIWCPTLVQKSWQLTSLSDPFAPASTDNHPSSSLPPSPSYHYQGSMPWNVSVQLCLDHQMMGTQYST